ncbi:MAG TPA: dihydroorotase family protein [Candidatus Dormibacteraeota bacterium]
MSETIRVAGGTVHSPGGPVEADVVVEGEKIAGFVSRGESMKAGEIIDAKGLHVFPGLVDLHAHARVPGYEYKEDFFTCSQAAAAGGITTFTDMPNVDPPTDSVELLEAKRKIAERDSIVDWGHLASPSKLGEIPKLAEAGVTGFKMFQVSGGYPHDPRIAMGDSEKVFEAFQAITKTGLHCSVHPYNQPLMDVLTRQAMDAGKPHDMATFSEIYTNEIVWSSAVAVLLELQRVTGVRLHLLHTHAAGSLRLIKAAKGRGQRVTCTVDPKYYHLTKEHVKEQGPRAAPGGYVTADADRMKTIWESLRDGTLDTIDSDHAPHTLEDLEVFLKDPWTGPFGSPQYEYMLSLALSDMHDGRYSLAHLVQLVSENAARIIGAYPRKGALQVGSDADLVLVDLDKEVKPNDKATYSKVGWTPYKGWTFRGGPVLTMLRGTVIAKDGKVVGQRGFGKYIRGTRQEAIPIEDGRAPGLSFRPAA